MKKIYKTKWGQIIDLEQLISLNLNDRQKLCIIFKNTDNEVIYSFQHIESDCDKEGTVLIVNLKRFNKRIELEINDLDKPKLTYAIAKSKRMSANDCIGYVFCTSNYCHINILRLIIPYRIGEFDKWIDKLYKYKYVGYNELLLTLNDK
jgi:hypothetical protein